MPEITAVTFDLWQTLLVDNRELGLTRSGARLEGVRRILADCGEGFDAEHAHIRRTTTQRSAACALRW